MPPGTDADRGKEGAFGDDAVRNGSAGSADEIDPDMDDVLDDLEDLENLVDSDEEREQVREAIRTARRADRGRAFGRIRSAFGSRDVGEALVGSFVFGIPMVVEGGTLEIGEAIADSVPTLVGTGLFGVAVVLGILHAARFEAVKADLLLGVVPVRLVSILVIAGTLSVGLMTAWARVDWSQPSVALAQCLLTAVVMAVGAAIGDILPE
ncbi:MAG: hypothetical protein V5A28_05965 [Haloarculaceae archaeon]